MATAVLLVGCYQIVSGDAQVWKEEGLGSAEGRGDIDGGLWRFYSVDCIPDYLLKYLLVLVVWSSTPSFHHHRSTSTIVDMPT